MVVDSQTLISSCVLNLERSWLDFKTANIGKSVFLHTVSQNSKGNVAPQVLSVVNNESRALQEGKYSKRQFPRILTVGELPSPLHS